MTFDRKAPNGLNLRRSIRNPKSGCNRILEYLYLRGMFGATKKEIIRDVFHKEVVRYNTGKDDGKVTCSWRTYLFILMLNNKLIMSHRRGRKVTYTITPYGFGVFTQAYEDNRKGW